MTSDPETYAESVVRVLREHFPDLTDPATALAVTDLIAWQARNPKDGFEVIVDNPVSAKWRLRPDSGNKCRVHVTCYRVHPREADTELERVVNDALKALEG